jgi:UDP-N-acetylmuramoyl-L-alanyl-D-glutamate--2,6-diaminopimelate ligase
MKFEGTGFADAYKRVKSSVVRMKYGNPAKDVKVIAVVGTNGKVTTARFIEEMLQEAGQATVRLEMEHTRAHTAHEVQEFLRLAKKNSAVYAILTLKSEDITEHSLGALPLEAVVVTNVSNTKAESLEKQVAAIDMLLDQAPKHTVLNRDDLSYEQLAEHISAAQDMTFGEHADSEARIDKKTLYKKGSEVRLVVDHRTSIELATYLVGEANVYNLAAAVAALYVIGEKITMLDEGAARLETVHGNYHYIESDKPYTVAVDYAPNDLAVLKVADSAHSLTKRRLIVVAQAENLQKDTIDTISKKAARTILVDEHEVAEKRGSLERVNTVETAVDRVLKTARKDDTVLFAGPMFVDKLDDIQGTITNTSEES